MRNIYNYRYKYISCELYLYISLSHYFHLLLILRPLTRNKRVKKIKRHIIFLFNIYLYILIDITLFFSSIFYKLTESNGFSIHAFSLSPLNQLSLTSLNFNPGVFLRAMSNGGKTASAAAHYRRRAADAVPEKESPSEYSETDTESDELRSENNGNGPQSIPHQRHPQTRRWWPEKWASRVDECVKRFLKSLMPRKHVCRTVFVILLMMVALSAYLRFFFILRGGGAVADGELAAAEKETMIITNFKNDLSATAQKAVFEAELHSSSAEEKRRRKKKIPVSWKLCGNN